MKLKASIFAAALALFCPTPVFAQTVAIVGGTVIDATGRPPIANATLVIRDGKIVAVGPSSEIKVPRGARRIAASGKYLIPGLMDANVHLGGAYSVEAVLKYEHRLPDLVLEGAQVLLKNGITTAFDSWGPLEASRQVRDDINSGKSTGLRLFFAGNIVGFTGILGKDFNGAGETALNGASLKRVNDIWEQGVGPDLMYMSVDQARSRFRDYLAKDVDFVKYGLNQHGSPFIAFSPRVQRMMVEESHRAGKIIQTHTMSVEGVNMAIDAGVDMMQHCEVTGPTPLASEDIKRLVDSGMPCALLAAPEEFLKVLGDDSTGMAMDYRVMDANVRALIKADANILLSTDTMFLDPYVASGNPAPGEGSKRERAFATREGFGAHHFEWLEAMQSKGYPPMKNLQAATRNVAAAYHVLDRLGTLEPGKIADIIILDADPLMDAANYRKIAMVIKAGKQVDRQALPSKPIIAGPQQGVDAKNMR